MEMYHWTHLNWHDGERITVIPAMCKVFFLFNSIVIGRNRRFIAKKMMKTHIEFAINYVECNTQTASRRWLEPMILRAKSMAFGEKKTHRKQFKTHKKDKH